MAKEAKSFTMSKLPVQNYSQNPRKAYGFAGETSLLRPIDATDRTDMRRVRALQDKQQDDFFIKENMSDQDLVDWINDRKKTERTDNYLIFGVAGDKAKQDGRVVELPVREKGELQGWLYLNPATATRQKELVDKGIISPPLEGQPPFMIAFVKFPGTPSNPTLGGQMASALRQACALMGPVDYSFHAKRIHSQALQQLGLNVDDLSDPAKLVQARQKEAELWRKHDMKPTQIIFGTVSPRNKESIRAVESAGFVRAKEMAKGTSDEFDYVYVLDWDKLHEKMQQQVMQGLKFKEKDVQLEKSKAPYPFQLEVFDSATGSLDTVREEVLALESSTGEGAFEREDLDEGGFDDSESTIIIARDNNGTAIGYTWALPAHKVYEREEDYEPFQGRTASSDTAYIYGTALLPEHRGKGYVAGLYDSLNTALLAKGYTRIHRDSAVENGLAANIIKNNQDRIISHHEHDSPFGKQEFIDMWIETPQQPSPQISS